jgi:WD repeat-containing protein 68
LDWCKTPAPGQQARHKSAFRIGVASFLDNYQNYIAVLGLQDEHVLVEDDFTDYPDFVSLVEAYHGYPATSLQWQPTTAVNHTWSQKSANTELLATTADALRVWEYSSDGPGNVSSYVGRPPTNAGHHSLTMKTALSGVCLLSPQISFCALTSSPAIESSKSIYWRTFNQFLVE